MLTSSPALVSWTWTNARLYISWRNSRSKNALPWRAYACAYQGKATQARSKPNAGSSSRESSRRRPLTVSTPRVIASRQHQAGGAFGQERKRRGVPGGDEVQALGAPLAPLAHQ